MATSALRRAGRSTASSEAEEYAPHRSTMKTVPAGRPAAGAQETSVPEEILRFRKSERTLHWSIAIPFMVCYATAAILAVFYNPNPLRPYRDVFSWAHRVSGVCLLVFPLLTLLRNRREYRIHLYNIKQAWIWTLDDLKWLCLMGLAAVSDRFSLPEQGKFNAAEKLNFMMVMCTYPLYIVTGVLIWLPGVGFLSWSLHVAMAIAATPLVLGHIFMATINPTTRVGLQGMISGFVDRQWAKHHYRRWYRENFEHDQGTERPADPIDRPPERIARVRCPSCRDEHALASWARLVQSVFEIAPLTCPSCGMCIDTLSMTIDSRELEWILCQLERRGSTGFFLALPLSGAPDALPLSFTMASASSGAPGSDSDRISGSSRQRAWLPWLRGAGTPSGSFPEDPAAP